MTNLLDLTHEELIVADAETIKQWKQAKIERKHKEAINIIAQGFNHIRFSAGSIVKIKKDGEYFYATRNGNGTGKNTLVTKVLLEAITEIDSLGWGDIVFYK